MNFHGNQLSWAIKHPFINLFQILFQLCLFFCNARPYYLKSKRVLLYLFSLYILSTDRKFFFLSRRQRINRRYESRGVSRFARVRRLKRCLIGFLDLMSVFMDNKQRLGPNKIQQLCQVRKKEIMKILLVLNMPWYLFQRAYDSSIIVLSLELHSLQALSYDHTVHEIVLDLYPMSSRRS